MFDNLIDKPVIIRSHDAGCHFGTLKAVDGENVQLANSRRLWRWWAKKSVSLSGLALHGMARRSEVRVAGALDRHVIRGWCEIIPCSDGAAQSIADCDEAVQ